MEHKLSQNEDEQALMAIHAAKASLDEFAKNRSQSEANQAGLILSEMEKAVLEKNITAVREYGKKLFMLLCRED